jgi:hypothetical protein
MNLDIKWRRLLEETFMFKRGVENITRRQAKPRLSRNETLYAAYRKAYKN